MKRGRIFCFLLIAVGLLSPSLNAREFRAGGVLFTGQLIVVDDGHGFTGLGGNLEYGISKHIGIGGDLFLVNQDEGSGGLLLVPSVAYHFDVKVRGLDLLAGVGYFMYTGFDWHPDARLKLFAGGRYFFSRRWAGCFKLILGLGSGGNGGIIGVTYRLK